MAMRGITGRAGRFAWAAGVLAVCGAAGTAVMARAGEDMLERYWERDKKDNPIRNKQRLATADFPLPGSVRMNYDDRRKGPGGRPYLDSISFTDTFKQTFTVEATPTQKRRLDEEYPEARRAGHGGRDVVVVGLLQSFREDRKDKVRIRLREYYEDVKGTFRVDESKKKPVYSIVDDAGGGVYTLEPDKKDAKAFKYLVDDYKDGDKINVYGTFIRHEERKKKETIVTWDLSVWRDPKAPTEDERKEAARQARKNAKADAAKDAE